MKIDTKAKKITYHEKEKEVQELTDQIMAEDEGLTLDMAAFHAVQVLPRHRETERVPALDPGFLYILSGGTMRLVDGIIHSTAGWGGGR